MFFAAEEDVRFSWPVRDSGSGFTPTEIQELLSLFQVANPVCSNSGSQGSDHGVSLIDDERRRKRMMSNRESARRSRLRKKKHLENLTVQVNRLKTKNQALKNQLSVVLNRYNMVRKQNERLRSEYVAVQGRLSDLYRIIVAMQIAMQRGVHANNVPSNLHS